MDSMGIEVICSVNLESCVVVNLGLRVALVSDEFF